jgi:hypothetical protein
MADRLARHDIPYMLSGSLALSYYAQPRMVRDSRSELQLRDVRNLLEAVAELDWLYLRRWAEDLRLTDLLDEVRR